MLPDVLDLGFATIKGYGLMIGVGLLVSYLVVQGEIRRRGLKRLDDRFPFLVVLIAVTAFLGGKLFYALTYPEGFGHLVDRGLLAVVSRGFVFYGAIVLCVPTTVLALRAWGQPVLPTIDVLILGVPLIHAFGRFGCFLAGCCYGSHCDLPWAVTFDQGQGLMGLPLHPVQLYEALGDLALFFFLWFVPRRRGRFPGQTLLLYLIGYALLRFCVEWFRGDGNPIVFGGDGSVHHAGEAPTGLTIGQATSIVILLVCVPLLVRGLRRHPRRSAES